MPQSPTSPSGPRFPRLMGFGDAPPSPQPPHHQHPHHQQALHSPALSSASSYPVLTLTASGADEPASLLAYTRPEFDPSVPGSSAGPSSLAIANDHLHLHASPSTSRVTPHPQSAPPPSSAAASASASDFRERSPGGFFAALRPNSPRREGSSGGSSSGGHNTAVASTSPLSSPSSPGATASQQSSLTAGPSVTASSAASTLRERSGLGARRPSSVFEHVGGMLERFGKRVQGGGSSSQNNHHHRRGGSSGATAAVVAPVGLATSMATSSMDSDVAIIDDRFSESAVDLNSAVSEDAGDALARYQLPPQPHLPSLASVTPHSPGSPSSRRISVLQRVLIQVTDDNERFSVVDVSGLSDAAAIKERMFSKLHLYDEDPANFALSQTEIGQAEDPPGPRIDDDALLAMCLQFGDSRGSLKFLLQQIAPASQPSKVSAPPANHVPSSSSSHQQQQQQHQQQNHATHPSHAQQGSHPTQSYSPRNSGHAHALSLSSRSSLSGSALETPESGSESNAGGGAPRLHRTRAIPRGVGGSVGERPNSLAEEDARVGARRPSSSNLGQRNRGGSEASSSTSSAAAAVVEARRERERMPASLQAGPQQQQPTEEERRSSSSSSSSTSSAALRMERDRDGRYPDLTMVRQDPQPKQPQSHAMQQQLSGHSHHAHQHGAQHQPWHSSQQQQQQQVTQSQPPPPPQTFSPSSAFSPQPLSPPQTFSPTFSHSYPQAGPAFSPPMSRPRTAFEGAGGPPPLSNFDRGRSPSLGSYGSARPAPPVPPLPGPPIIDGRLHDGRMLLRPATVSSFVPPPSQQQPQPQQQQQQQQQPQPHPGAGPYRYGPAPPPALMGYGHGPQPGQRLVPLLHSGHRPHTFHEQPGAGGPGVSILYANARPAPPTAPFRPREDPFMALHFPASSSRQVAEFQHRARGGAPSSLSPGMTVQETLQDPTALHAFGPREPRMRAGAGMGMGMGMPPPPQQQQIQQQQQQQQHHQPPPHPQLPQQHYAQQGPSQPSFQQQQQQQQQMPRQPTSHPHSRPLHQQQSLQHLPRVVSAEAASPSAPKHQFSNPPQATASEIREPRRRSADELARPISPLYASAGADQVLQDDELLQIRPLPRPPASAPAGSTPKPTPSVHTPLQTQKDESAATEDGSTLRAARFAELLGRLGPGVAVGGSSNAIADDDGEGTARPKGMDAGGNEAGTVGSFASFASFDDDDDDDAEAATWAKPLEPVSKPPDVVSTAPTRNSGGSQSSSSTATSNTNATNVTSATSTTSSPANNSAVSLAGGGGSSSSRRPVLTLDTAATSTTTTASNTTGSSSTTTAMTTAQGTPATTATSTTPAAAPSDGGTGPTPQPPTLSPGSGISRRTSFAAHRDTDWAPRPPPEQLYERLDDFFPKHDLDRPVLETPGAGGSPLVDSLRAEPQELNGESEGDGDETQDLPMAPGALSLTPGVARRHKKSIRIVAQDRKKFLERVAKPEGSGGLGGLGGAGGSGSGAGNAGRPGTSEGDHRDANPDELALKEQLGRRRSTKLWGGKVVEMTAAGQPVNQTVTSAGGAPDSGGRPVFKWVKGDLIGKGTYGRVYLALNATTGEMIAVKQVELPRTASDHEDGRQRSVVAALKSEIETLKDLDHPHIVSYLGFEETETFLSIFLEYIPGGSIASVLRKYGKLDEPTVKFFTNQILDGLSYLHQRGVLHRDLKGDNLLVTLEGIVKVTDFGTVRHSEDIYANIETMSVQGSVFWMAPEILNSRGYSAKVDIWSLGCVCLEMFAGRRPWSDADAVQAMFRIGAERRAPPVPADVRLSKAAAHFLRNCFEVEPEKRPTAAKLLTHVFPHSEPGWNFANSALSRALAK